MQHSLRAIGFLVPLAAAAVFTSLLLRPLTANVGVSATEDLHAFIRDRLQIGEDACPTLAHRILFAVEVAGARELNTPAFDADGNGVVTVEDSIVLFTSLLETAALPAVQTACAAQVLPSSAAGSSAFSAATSSTSPHVACTPALCEGKTASYLCDGTSWQYEDIAWPSLPPANRTTAPPNPADVYCPAGCTEEDAWTGWPSCMSGGEYSEYDVGQHTTRRCECRHCCSCIYQAVPHCASLPEEECYTNLDYRTDCLWDGGVCKSRFELFCDQWIASQPQCAPERSFITPRDADAYPPLEQCTSLDFIHMGHGQACQTYAMQITACLLLCEDAACFQFQNIGCSMFSNEEAVDAWIATLQRSMIAQGKSITISANQTISSWPTCQNRLTYDLKAGMKTYERCNPGGFCFKDSTSIQCTAPDESVVTVQCCACGHRFGVWSGLDGSCPPLTSVSEVSPVLEVVRSNAEGGCPAAFDEVWPGLHQQAATADQACNAKGGAFEWSPSLNWYPSEHSCTVVGSIQYSCTDMCK